MEAEIIKKNLDTKSIEQMWEDLLTQPCVIIANLQNILQIHFEDGYHAVCGIQDIGKRVLESCSSGFLTKARES